MPLLAQETIDQFFDDFFNRCLLPLGHHLQRVE
jgi:hypothetical protein